MRMIFKRAAKYSAALWGPAGLRDHRFVNFDPFFAGLHGTYAGRTYFQPDVRFYLSPEMSEDVAQRRSGCLAQAAVGKQCHVLTHNG